VRSTYSLYHRSSKHLVQYVYYQIQLCILNESMKWHHTASGRYWFCITDSQIYGGCLTVHLPHEITWNTNLMQQGNFSAPSFWMGGGLESLCVGRVYGGDVAVRHGTTRTVHTTYAEALKTTTHSKTRCRKPYAATQHLMLLMMGVCTRNMSR